MWVDQLLLRFPDAVKEEAKLGWGVGFTYDVICFVIRQSSNSALWSHTRLAFAVNCCIQWHILQFECGF